MKNEKHKLQLDLKKSSIISSPKFNRIQLFIDHVVSKHLYCHPYHKLNFKIEQSANQSHFILVETSGLLQENECWDLRKFWKAFDKGLSVALNEMQKLLVDASL